MLFFKTTCTVDHPKYNALQTLIWHSCVLHLMTFNFVAIDTLLIQQDSMEKN